MHSVQRSLIANILKVASWICSGIAVGGESGATLLSLAEIQQL
jgi:hypothetical protein